MTKKSAVNLCKQLFNNIKEKILRQIVLMICNWFIFSVLDKCQKFEEIEASVSVLSSSELEDLFQSKKAFEALKIQRERLLEQLATYQTKEQSEISPLFSFPNVGN